jgi:hypothetical protein
MSIETKEKQSVRNEIYLSRYKAIKEAFNNTNNWEEVYNTEVYSDPGDPSNRAFLDLLEKEHKTEVKSGAQILKLTNLGKEYLKDVNKCFFEANLCRYMDTLEDIIYEGGTYSDLMNVDPKDFNLPESWKDGYYTKDKNTAVLRTIEAYYLIGETIGSMLIPSFRDIAKDIEAPYSVIMDCFKIDSLLEIKIKDQYKRLEVELRAYLIEYIDKQPKSWKLDRVLIGGRTKEEKEHRAIIKEQYIEGFLNNFKMLSLHNALPNKVKLDEGAKAIEEEVNKHFKEYLDRAVSIYSVNNIKTIKNNGTPKD